MIVQDRYDTVVIGGGLGGLLAAVVAVREGRSVLVVERLPQLGGRFTTVGQDPFRITTGALHLVPHGNKGILARLLTDLEIPLRYVPRDVLAAFHFRGQQFAWRHIHDIPRIFGLRTALDLLKIVATLTLEGSPDPAMSFGTWLRRQTGNPTSIRLAERVTEFSLSAQTEDVSTRAVRGVVRNTLRYGLPMSPIGGCTALVDELASHLRARRVDIRLRAEVIEIRLDATTGSVCGVVIRDRKSGAETTVEARQVVSDIGPKMTAALVANSPDAAPRFFPAEARSANGIKLHVVSDKSLIPHNGVLICLDTERISAIVQVSNAVGGLTPPGSYLLDTFQVPRTTDIAYERRLAVADLRNVLGSDFDRHCRIVRTSAFRGDWPVNRSVQGTDGRDQQPIPGLVMVGDAYKPADLLMVEGVAASVKNVIPTLTRVGPHIGRS